MSVWFQAPAGTSGSLSVQQQEFHPIVMSGPMVDGRPTERVLYEMPDRFAQHLAGLPGFLPCPAPDNLPEGYVSPVPNPESQTIDALAAQVGFHKQELVDRDAVIDLLKGRVESVSFDRDQLRIELEEVKTQLSNAMFEIEQIRTPVEPSKKG